jgi:hypothetical protein
VTDPSAIRAVRNLNPGNIRHGQQWQVLAAVQPDPDFCTFTSAVMGFRAMAEIFHTYYTQDGIRTLRQAITRWAPPTENNTEAYVENVCDYTAWKPDVPFPFYGSVATQAALLKAVSIHEAGGWYFQQADLLAGVQAAR